MRYAILATLPAALLLASCDTSKLPTAEQIQQVEVSIQNGAIAVCKAAPTIESIGIIAASLIAGGVAVDQVANQVINQFCNLVLHPPASAGPHLAAVPGSSGYVGSVNGYPIYKK